MRIAESFIKKLIHGLADLRKTKATDSEISTALKCTLVVSVLPSGDKSNAAPDLYFEFRTLRGDTVMEFTQKNISLGDSITMNGLRIIQDFVIT